MVVTREPASPRHVVALPVQAPGRATRTRLQRRRRRHARRPCSAYSTPRRCSRCTTIQMSAPTSVLTPCPLFNIDLAYQGGAACSFLGWNHLCTHLHSHMCSCLLPDCRSLSQRTSWTVCREKCWDGSAGAHPQLQQQLLHSPRVWACSGAKSPTCPRAG